jgi:hypothetical protein
MKGDAFSKSLRLQIRFHQVRIRELDRLDRAEFKRVSPSDNYYAEMRRQYAYKSALEGALDEYLKFKGWR